MTTIRERLIDVLASHFAVNPDDAVDEVLDVLRADPSAVIAALGGTRIGWLTSPVVWAHEAAGAHAHLWHAQDRPDDLPVWVLGEQP